MLGMRRHLGRVVKPVFHDGWYYLTDTATILCARRQQWNMSYSQLVALIISTMNLGEWRAYINSQKSVRVVAASE